jgi:choloylglycine hydrolase
MKNKLLTTVGAVLLLVSASTRDVQSCTRVLNVSTDGKYVITGRNMDWYTRYDSSFWKFPRGLERNGLSKENPLTWRSKYGSVVVVQTAEGQNASTDGLNEKGLAVNMMYLTEADYGKRDSSKKGLASSLYIQYILDNFATVNEVVATFEKGEIQLDPVPIPNSKYLPTMHFALSDETGDSAIFEYIKGKLIIHHSSEYQVMANSPTFEKQLVLTSYWNEIGGDKFLPGTRKSADRFVRASFYNKALPDPKNYSEAVAGVMSIMRNVSSPFGKADPKKPNISSTLWRVIADNKDKIYFYESTLSPNVIWIDFKNMDFSKASKIKKIDLDHNPNLVGEVSRSFKQVKELDFAKP